MSESENRVLIIVTGERHVSPNPVLDPIEAEIVKSVPGLPIPGEAWRVSFAGVTYRATLGVIVEDDHRVTPTAIRNETAVARTKQELLSKILAKHHNATAWLDRQVKATEKAMKQEAIAEETTVSGRTRRAVRRACRGLPSKWRYRVAAEVARDNITDPAAIEFCAQRAETAWKEKLRQRKEAKVVTARPEPPKSIEISTKDGPQRLVRRTPAVSTMLAAAILAGSLPDIHTRRPMSPPYPPS